MDLPDGGGGVEDVLDHVEEEDLVELPLLGEVVGQFVEPGDEELHPLLGHFG
ncbi:MAG: hypothetical protein U0835_24375 [Isosphaeraceae bacterium]